MSKKSKTISEEVQRIILESRLSRYRICKTIGMQQSVMSRFMGGTGGISTPMLDALGELLGFGIVQYKAGIARKGR